MSLIRELSSAASYEIPAYQEGSDVKAAGLSVADHYLTRMGPFRYRIRSYLLPIVRAETPYLAALQQKFRNNALDMYFVYSANLGTHTAFLVGLPLIFWFGSYSIANGLVDVLAAGVFFSGFMKDYFCLPRPLSPPLHRITMSGSAALEYGFPSSHSTNACSIAFYAFALLQSYQGSPVTKFVYQVLAAFYVFSIVFGRLYCGMHGFLDVIVGSLLGFGIGWARWSCTDMIESYISNASAMSSFILILLIICMVRLHPEPADSCPCFDDGVAFAGVVIGQYFSFWRFSHEIHNGPQFVPLHPGHFTIDTSDMHALGYFARVVLGVGMIIMWRAVTKPILHSCLPPLFRALEPIGVLIPRKGFASALLYSTVPKDLPDEVLPSIKEIPSMVRNFRRPRTDSVGPQSAADVYEAVAYKNRQRRLSNQTYNDAERTEDSDSMKKLIEKPRVRYDVEVVTKLVVYSGVGWIAIDLVPRACLLVFGK
ncbi:Sphingosine-1-phosphate phosphohydrolase [Taphrina deformans PYCC 5710]|uniref:Sphingosine-1-phosphate phosphohydrolase n=1 Tax=Taphrina deformans (strain PYCC 5710 / ATCC 11124 / CBS 356.35 / IMI 108563 / JCM 9778 / NBRC 8474) TaxID=1097556 RepID=R4X818_TAPDE|nr:Sphingosine-1-phosphate phosphohydrolase [Taphrina deformans PYCC 5710]|eukprot:CCG81594.1 Sphingosine-1-phosphate phosphohydrolase [Taphrina deformans PYCC 5710]